MRLFGVLLITLTIGCTFANQRDRRQAQGYGGAYQGAAAYRPQPQGYQPQQQQAYQQPQQQQNYHGQGQHYPARPARPHATAPNEEEKEEGPHPLQVLLEKSKFECGGKSDGYYADSDVGCQAFHYCVSGQKHSMMCPEGTVFHQVHLNCVPADQDICSKANQFYFVNDYLNKPLDQRGPNNTIQYHQRYYPDNYAVGDPFIPPQDSGKKETPAATYGLGPAYREQAPQQQTYQPQPSSHHRPQQPAPVQPVAYAPQQQAYPAAPHRPYQAPAQQQSYQAAPAPQRHQPAAQRHQPAAQPVVYGYGGQQSQQQHQAQALQAQRAYAQQAYQAVQPQQHLYNARQRYA